jgi:hypothetical protein
LRELLPRPQRALHLFVDAYPDQPTVDRAEYEGEDEIQRPPGKHFFAEDAFPAKPDGDARVSERQRSADRREALANIAPAE